MIKKLISRLFKKNQDDDIKFRCHDGAHNLSFPIQLARKMIPEWIKPQVKDPKVEHTFPQCPGMFDIAQAGYIIPAWCDIHIKANKQGIFVKLDRPLSRESDGTSYMDFEVVRGLAPLKKGAPEKVMKLSLPWSIFCKPGVYAQVIPAVMHSPFLDKLYVYSGMVDYDRFSTVNFAFSVLEECEFTIWAGTPLLQVIPVVRKEFTASCSKSSEYEKDKHKFHPYSRSKNFYRRNMHQRKNYDLTHF